MVKTLAGAEVLTDTGILVRKVSIGFISARKYLCIQVFHSGGAHIEAGELDSALRHRHTVIHIDHGITNQQVKLIANNNHFKGNAVVGAVVILMQDQFPLIPAVLICLGHGKELELAGISPLKGEDIFVLCVCGNHESCLTPVTCVGQTQLALDAVVVSAQRRVAALHIIHLVFRIGIGSQSIDALSGFCKVIRCQADLCQRQHIVLCLLDSCVGIIANHHRVVAGS